MSARGSGTPSDPVRDVTQFWSGNGKLLAESDPERTEETFEILLDGAGQHARLRAEAIEVIEAVEAAYGSPIYMLGRAAALADPTRDQDLAVIAAVKALAEEARPIDGQDGS